MQVNRIDLLDALKSIQPGLSKREIVDQSSCFVFVGGQVFTYNEEIACSCDFDIGFEGAVQAESLLTILEKLTEEEIRIEEGEGELRYYGKKREGGIRMENEIVLPFDEVEVPNKKKWTRMDRSFGDAINIVSRCASSDASNFNLTCVHIFPDWVEACDNLQVARYNVPTGVDEPTLVRRDSIKHIKEIELDEVAETKSWLHFRCKDNHNVMMSCRRHLRNELDQAAMFNVTELFNFSGKKIKLPKGLNEAAQNANVFAKENTGDNLYVLCEVKKSKMRITGRSVSGWYREVKPTEYNGKSFEFKVDPGLLVEITEQYETCEVTEERIKVTAPKFTYVAVLHQERDEEEEDGDQ